MFASLVTYQTAPSGPAASAIGTALPGSAYCTSGSERSIRVTALDPYSVYQKVPRGPVENWEGRACEPPGTRNSATVPSAATRPGDPDVAVGPREDAAEAGGGGGDRELGEHARRRDASDLVPPALGEPQGAARPRRDRVGEAARGRDRELRDRPARRDPADS